MRIKVKGVRGAGDREREVKFKPEDSRVESFLNKLTETRGDRIKGSQPGTFISRDRVRGGVKVTEGEIGVRLTDLEMSEEGVDSFSNDFKIRGTIIKDIRGAMMNFHRVSRKFKTGTNPESAVFKKENNLREVDTKAMRFIGVVSREDIKEAEGGELRDEEAVRLRGEIGTIRGSKFNNKTEGLLRRGKTRIKVGIAGDILKRFKLTFKGVKEGIIEPTEGV